MLKVFMFMWVVFGQFAYAMDEFSAENNKSVGCIKLSAVKPVDTPVAIYLGVRDCIMEEDYTKAARLTSIAGVYGIFDTKRVLDRSAHQAPQVVFMSLLGSLNKEQHGKLFAHVKQYSDQGSDKHNKLCSEVREIGAPTYFPSYMVRHGMGAMIDALEQEEEKTPDSTSPLKEDFDATSAWEDALDRYLHCSGVAS